MRVKLTAVLQIRHSTYWVAFNCFPRSVCPACGVEVDNLVEYIVLRCPRHADVRHKMWLKMWNNFGVYAYIKWQV